MPRSSILHKDEQKIWRLVTSRCPFYRCNIELIKEGREGILGQMAHIVARSEDWARGQPKRTSKERDRIVSFYSVRIIML